MKKQTHRKRISLALCGISAYHDGQSVSRTLTHYEGSAMHRRQGRGSALSHHGEILQGEFRAPSGRLSYGLISVPCGLFGSESTFAPQDRGDVVVVPERKWKARRAAELTLRRLSVDRLGGKLSIRSSVPEKIGLGSSTSDVISAIRAVSDALRIRLSSEEILSIAVEAETASDPILIQDRFVLFAQREGRILRMPPCIMPKFEILGFDAGSCGEGIETLQLKLPSYTQSEIEMFEMLWRLFRRAVRRGDVPLLGKVATESARINQRRLPLAGFGEFERIGMEMGASGIQISHSGSVVGFILPADPLDETRVLRGIEELRAGMGMSEFWRFRPGKPADRHPAAPGEFVSPRLSASAASL